MASVRSGCSTNLLLSAQDCLQCRSVYMPLAYFFVQNQILDTSLGPVCVPLCMPLAPFCTARVLDCTPLCLHRPAVMHHPQGSEDVLGTLCCLRAGVLLRPMLRGLSSVLTGLRHVPPIWQFSVHWAPLTMPLCLRAVGPRTASGDGGPCLCGCAAAAAAAQDDLAPAVPGSWWRLAVCSALCLRRSAAVGRPRGPDRHATL